MLRNHQRLLHRGIQTCDLLCVGGGVWCAAVPIELSRGMIQLQALVICVGWAIVTQRLGFYQPRRTETLARELGELLEAWFVALAIGAWIAHEAWGVLAFDPLVTFVLVLGLIGCCRVALRLCLRRLRTRGWNFREVILVGRGNASRDVAELVRTRPHFGVRLVGSVSLPGEIGDSPDGVADLGEASQLADLMADRHVDSVLLCPSGSVEFEATKAVLETCDIAGIQCCYMPELADPINLEADVASFGDIPALRFHVARDVPLEVAVKRAIDAVGSSVGLVLCFPVLVTLAIAEELRGEPLDIGKPWTFSP